MTEKTYVFWGTDRFKPDEAALGVLRERCGATTLRDVAELINRALWERVSVYFDERGRMQLYGVGEPKDFVASAMPIMPGVNRSCNEYDYEFDMDKFLEWLAEPGEDVHVMVATMGVDGPVEQT